MYHAKIWDEDKLNIHSKSYGSSKYGNIFAEGMDKHEDKRYNEQKYGSKENNASSDYMRKQDEKEKDEKKQDVFDELEVEKNEKEIKEEELPFRAAKQMFSEKQHEAIKFRQKKDINSIEDAIKKLLKMRNRL